jgi:hypothetical protein
MTYFNYLEEGDIQNNKKPFNTHLIWETDYGIYFVDASDQTVLLKTTNEGTTVTTVETRTQKIQSGFYDKPNDKIYFTDGDNDGVSTVVDCWNLDLTDDSVTEMATITIGAPV